MRKQKLVVALALTLLLLALAKTPFFNMGEAFANNQTAATPDPSNNASSPVSPNQMLNSLQKQFDADKPELRREIEQYAKDHNATQVKVTITSIEENQTYSNNTIPLCFTASGLSTYKYCINGQENITIDGNTTLTDLPIGYQILIVYGEDSAGNVAASQAVNFTITQQKETDTQVTPFPANYAIIAAGAIVALMGLGLIVNRKMRVSPYNSSNVKGVLLREQSVPWGE